MTETQTPAPEAEQDARWSSALHKIAAGNAIAGVLAVVLAVVLGSLLIIATNEDVRDDPSIGTMWDTITGAYTAMFQGAIYNPNAVKFSRAIRPLTETLTYAGPLIVSGLGVGLAFRAGLFNIGGRGQMLMAGAFAGWVGFKLDLPAPLHVTLGVVVGIAAGALWGGLAGYLKARTGAHEVILTIMLNYVAFYLVFFALTRKNLLQAPSSNNPKSLPMKESAVLPKLFGVQYNLHLGFIISLVAVALVWWLLNRSSLGFRFRAVGENPSAAQAAGISVSRTYTTVMMMAGGLVGFAGVYQVLGTNPGGVTNSFDSGIGFDAITVALLGRSRPLGILGAGLLFGAFKAGGYAMQGQQQIPVDIVLVLESLIVLFIAAPPLVRAIFHLPSKAGETA